MSNDRKQGLRNGLSLAWMLAKRDLKNRYASSYAGFAWNIGVPLLYSLINVIVFSILMSGRMGARYGDVPFSLFYFVPFSLWTMFADVVGRSPGILREYAYLINKIAFPAWVLPIVPFASAFLSQGIILLLTAFLAVYLDVGIGSEAWLYLPLWAIAVVLTLGIAYAVSALAVYIPDLVQAVPVGVTILFWLTPILYPATLVENHGALWVRNIIMDFNPFYYLADLSRYAVFGGAPVSWETLGWLALVAAGTLGLGVLVFRKLRSGFADVL
jgi:ABC-type polysaccharide/polyol phosphate export permease